MTCIYCGGEGAVPTDVGPVCDSDECSSRLDLDCWILDFCISSEDE